MIFSLFLIKVQESDDALNVSVVIPAYNASKHVERAIESVLNQSGPTPEIIVVDDASSDNTADIAQGYSASGVRLIRNPQNLGVAATRNVGIRASDSELVAFLDADDEWLPRKLECQREVLSHDLGTTFVTCGADNIDAGGTNMGGVYSRPKAVKGDEAWRCLLSRAGALTSSVVVRRKAIEEVGGFNETMAVAEDQDMWIRLALAGRLGHVPEVLVYKHDTPESLSNTDFRTQAAAVLTMIKGHINDNRTRLSRQEIRHVMRCRLELYGRLTYRSGDVGYGTTMLIRAMLNGASVTRTLSFLVKKSGPANWLQSKAAGGYDKKKRGRDI